MLRLLALCALLTPMAAMAIPLYPETGDLIGADRAPAAADRDGSRR